MKEFNLNSVDLTRLRGITGHRLCTLTSREFLELAYIKEHGQTLHHCFGRIKSLGGYLLSVLYHLCLLEYGVVYLVVVSAIRAMQSMFGIVEQCLGKFLLNPCPCGGELWAIDNCSPFSHGYVPLVRE